MGLGSSPWPVSGPHTGVAQLVEHRLRGCEVLGSIPGCSALAVDVGSNPTDGPPDEIGRGVVGLIKWSSGGLGGAALEARPGFK